MDIIKVLFDKNRGSDAPPLKGGIAAWIFGDKYSSGNFIRVARRVTIPPSNSPLYTRGARCMVAFPFCKGDKTRSEKFREASKTRSVRKS